MIGKINWSTYKAHKHWDRCCKFLFWVGLKYSDISVVNYHDHPLLTVLVILSGLPLRFQVARASCTQLVDREFNTWEFFSFCFLWKLLGVMLMKSLALALNDSPELFWSYVVIDYSWLTLSLMKYDIVRCWCTFWSLKFGILLCNFLVCLQHLASLSPLRD